MNIANLEYLESSVDATELITGGARTTVSAWTNAGFQQGSANGSASAYGEHTLTNAQSSTTINNSRYYSTTTSLANARAYARDGNNTSNSSADSQSWAIHAW
jgi:hypothetical protein